MTIYFIKEGYEHVKCSICKKHFAVGDPYTESGAGKKGKIFYRHVACVPPEQQEMTGKKKPAKGKRKEMNKRTVKK